MAKACAYLCHQCTYWWLRWIRWKTHLKAIAVWPILCSLLLSYAITCWCLCDWLWVSSTWHAISAANITSIKTALKFSQNSIARVHYTTDRSWYVIVKPRLHDTTCCQWQPVSSSSSSWIIVRPLPRITTMGGAHRSGCVTELRLKCGDSIRVDAGFR